MKRKTKIIQAISVSMLFVSITACKTKTTSSSTHNMTTSAITIADRVKIKQWTEIFTIKGNGVKKSAVFTLTGAKARVKYKFTTEDMGLFSFYVVPEGEDVMTQGGFPEVMTQQAESSETYITKSAGNYYLNVNSSGGHWAITVEEEK